MGNRNLILATRWSLGTKGEHKLEMKLKLVSKNRSSETGSELIKNYSMWNWEKSGRVEFVAVLTWYILEGERERPRPERYCERIMS